MRLNKSFLTNLLSLVLIGAAFILSEPFHTHVLYMGLFALSGALMNTLAVHMLFEKVPFLYGSGVIGQSF